MKICFSTLGCPEWTWDRIVDEARQLGYDGIEIRGIEGEMHLPKARPFRQGNRSTTMAQLEDAQLEISCLGTSASFHDADKWQTNLDMAMEHIDLAAELQVPFVRVFGDKIPEPANKDEVISQIVIALQHLGQYARGSGVRVVIETHGDFSRSSDLKLILDEVSMPEIGVLWDMHHPYRFYNEIPKETMNIIGNRVYHTHIKDSQMKDGTMHYCLVGEGDLPIQDCLSLLVNIGYKGWVSLEWEKKWHPELAEPEVAFPQFLRVIKGILHGVI
ncbi:MAG: TIM barrel protein [Firmicutes bacterium]|jgi:sugar phosphate isomerase/epimerase|nr:TIM barrel protein [Bacillota bacterium]